MVIFFWIGFPVTEMVTGTYLREMRPKYSSARQAAKLKIALSDYSSTLSQGIEKVVTKP